MKLKVLILSALFCLPSFAQINLSLTGGSDYYNEKLGTKPDYLGLNWESGININLAGEYFLSPRISINTSLEYSIYKFKGLYIGVSIPESRLVSSSGENSNQFTVSTFVKFYIQPKGNFRVYLMTGLGYTKAQLGKINALFSDLNFGKTYAIIEYPDFDSLIFSSGLGFKYYFVKNLAVEVSTSYLSDYSNFFKTRFNVGLSYPIEL